MITLSNNHTRVTQARFIPKDTILNSYSTQSQLCKYHTAHDKHNGMVFAIAIRMP